MKDILEKVYLNKPLYRALYFADVALTLIFFAFGIALGISSIISGFSEALSVALVLGVPFLLVSILRRVIDCKRPYEIFGFYTDAPRKRGGRSFPSRHMLSAALIATLYFAYNTVIAIVLSLLTLALGVLRVLLGYHFPRDIIAGLIIGVIGSAVGIFILL